MSSTGAATGTAIVTGVSKRLIPAVGESIGVATVTGISKKLSVGTGAAVGAAVVAGISTTANKPHYLLAAGNNVDTLTGGSSPGAWYWPIGGAPYTNTTESAAQRNVGIPGTYKSMGVRVTANTFSTGGDSAVYTFRKNGASGNQAIQIANLGAGYFTDAVHEDIVIAGDQINMALIHNNGTKSVTSTEIFLQFSAGTDLVFSNTTTGQNVSLVYMPIAGTTQATNPMGYTTEDGLSQVIMRAPGIASSLQITLQNNNSLIASTLRVRKNSANGNQAVSIPIGTNGTFVDATHTDAITSGDLFNTSISTDGRTFIPTALSISIAPNAFKQDVVASVVNALTLATGNSLIAFGGSAFLSATESPVQAALPMATSLGHLRCYCNSDGTAAVTISIRKNGVTGNSAISIPGGAAGVFEDTIHTDSFVAGDSINYLAVGGAGSSRHMGWIASTLTQSVPVIGVGHAVGLAIVTGQSASVGHAIGLAIVTGHGAIALPPIGPITAGFQVNGVIYGMIGSGRYPGYDEPFAYKISTNSLLPLTGIKPTTIPVQPPTTGTWVPPSMTMIGTTIVVTHPGFNGAFGNYFGWFDVSVDGSPSWHTGNTTGTLPGAQLLQPPQCVGQFNDRFYFGVGNAIVPTDAGTLNISNPGNVLIAGDKTPINRFIAQPISTTSVGIFQAIIALKTNSIFQITGDPITSNWVLNEMSDSLGTDAPRSVVQTPEGIKFKAVDGIRTIDAFGGISDPDPDVAVPFINALYPSRISAGYNSNIYRVCVQNGNAPGTPFQEYWMDLKRGGWTGPHTFRQDLLIPYKGTFIGSSNAFPTDLFKTDVVQTGFDHFIEAGVAMSFIYRTTDMTQVGNMYANSTVKSTIELLLPQDGATYAVSGLDEDSNVLASASFVTRNDYEFWHPDPVLPLWGDGSTWGTDETALRPRTIPWTEPLIFNRLVEEITGPCSQNFKVGSFYTAYERLNYMLP